MVVIILWKTILTGWVLNPRKEHYRKCHSPLSALYWFTEYVDVCSTLSIIPEKSRWLHFSLVKWEVLHTDAYTEQTNPICSRLARHFLNTGRHHWSPSKFQVWDVPAEEQEETCFFCKHRKLLPGQVICLFCTLPLNRLCPSDYQVYVLYQKGYSVEEKWLYLHRAKLSRKPF